MRYSVYYLIAETPTRLIPLYRVTDSSDIQDYIQRVDADNDFVVPDSEQPDQKTERLYVVERTVSDKLILRTSILRNKLTCNRTNKTIIGTASVRHPDSEIEAERFRSILLPS